MLESSTNKAGKKERKSHMKQFHYSLRAWEGYVLQDSSHSGCVFNSIRAVVEKQDCEHWRGILSCAHIHSYFPIQSSLLRRHRKQAACDSCCHWQKKDLYCPQKGKAHLLRLKRKLSPFWLVTAAERHRKSTEGWLAAPEEGLASFPPKNALNCSEYVVANPPWVETHKYTTWIFSRGIAACLDWAFITKKIVHQKSRKKLIHIW